MLLKQRRLPLDGLSVGLPPQQASPLMSVGCPLQTVISFKLYFDATAVLKRKKEEQRAV